MKRVLVLFGEAGCRIAQGVLWAACAGAWSGETDVLLVANGACAELVERTSLLFARYERLRALMDALPGARLGFTAPLQLRAWLHALPHATMADWAQTQEEKLLCRALFDEQTAAADLNGDLTGKDHLARAVFAELLRGKDKPLSGLEENLAQGQEVRLLLGGSMADGWSAAGMDALTRDIVRRAENWKEQLNLASLVLAPYKGEDGQAHPRAAAALKRTAHGEAVYALGLSEADCASAGTETASVVEWLSACCADSFFRAERAPTGLMSYRVAAGKLGWESFPAAYRVCFGSLMKTSAAFRLNFEPVIRRGLTSPKWLRDKMIAWYAGYFRQAAKAEDDQRQAWLRELDDASTLLENYRTWTTELLRGLPPLLRSASALEEARQAASENYRQYIETSAQLTVMCREAEESGLSQEKMVHRHDMADNESEKMLKVFEQIDMKRQTLLLHQQQMNQRIGGAATLLMMKEHIRRLKAEAADLHAQAREAARRIDEAERVAALEDQHKIATARTKLQRMERYLAQVDASLALAQQERRQAKAENIRRMPPEIAMDAALPENALFDPVALDALDMLGGQEDREGKRRWTEAENAWTGLVLPLRGNESTLQEIAAQLKTKEEHASPVAALMRDMMLLMAKEVR